MRKRLHSWGRARNFWIGLLLLLANGFVWARVINGRTTLPEVAPVLHPEIAEIRAHWQARDAIGQSFEIVVTDQMAAETIAWFIEPRQELPFSHPQVHIYPDRIEGGGLIRVMGLQTIALGTATVRLENGRLVPTIKEIEVGGATAPPFVLTAVAQGQVVYDNLSLPIEITEMELRQGEVYLRGVYR